LQAVYHDISQKKHPQSRECQFWEAPMKRTIASCLLSSLTLLTGLLVAPAVCRADHWERIHDNPSQGLSYHVDTESIVIQGGLVRAWDRVVYTRPKSDSQGRLIFSQKYYKSYDCWERVSRNIQSIDYADRDSTAIVGEITQYSSTWPLNSAANGSAEEKLINFVCSKAAVKLRTDR
jgi:hypothetical protein